MNKRIRYVIFLVLVIATGLGTRRIDSIPSATGDLLYALMMCCIVRILLIRKPAHFVALLGLGVCYIIELSQLYQATWLLDLRRTLPGRLVLGQGFLWSDLLAYSIGALLFYVLEKAAVEKLK